jgi:Cyclic nucleotide-binding domain
MSEPVGQPSGNNILDALPPEDYDRLASHLAPVELPHGQIIYRSEQRIEHLYFPLAGMISLVSQLSDGTNVEVGVTGPEGMAGLSLLLGVKESPHECMVQIPGGGVQVKADVVKSEFDRGGALRDLLLRYVHTMSESGWRAGS